MATRKPPSSASLQPPPSDAAIKHANKISHRNASGQFKQPPSLQAKQPPHLPQPVLPPAGAFPDPLNRYADWDDEAS